MLAGLRDALCLRVVTEISLQQALVASPKEARFVLVAVGAFEELWESARVLHEPIMIRAKCLDASAANKAGIAKILGRLRSDKTAERFANQVLGGICGPVVAEPRTQGLKLFVETRMLEFQTLECAVVGCL